MGDVLKFTRGCADWPTDAVELRLADDEVMAVFYVKADPGYAEDVVPLSQLSDLMKWRDQMNADGYSTPTTDEAIRLLQTAQFHPVVPPD